MPQSTSAPEGGLLKQYKPEQGKWTRRGTFVGAGAVIAWGAYFVHDRLQGYAGDEAWRLLIAPGIPILLMVVLGAAAYWVSLVSRKSSDFMIATEGEMKKVNWSTRREVLGATKVVIATVIALGTILFMVNIVFMFIFEFIGVLRVDMISRIFRVGAE